MFYLLEDNRIIKYSEKFSHIFCYENRKGLLYKVFSDKNYGKNRKIGKIKKQSENVFDLIEVGDLVLSDPESKERYSVSGIVEITEIRKNDGYISFSTNADSFDFDCKLYGVEWYCIYAIYKLNSKGDYIKVWEKKDE